MSNRTKMQIKYVPGVHAGWTSACPLCPSITVRPTWDIAMAQTYRHIAVHQSGPFANIPGQGRPGPA